MNELNQLFGKELREWFFQNLANIVTIFGFLTAIWLLVIAVNNPEEPWLIMLLAGAVGLSDLIDLTLMVTVFLAVKSLEGYYQSFSEKIENNMEKTKKLS